MECNIVLGCLEQLRHLCLAEPHGVILHTHLQAYGLVGLVKDYLAFGLLPGHAVLYAVIFRFHRYDCQAMHTKRARKFTILFFNLQKICK